MFRRGPVSQLAALSPVKPVAGRIEKGDRENIFRRMSDEYEELPWNGDSGKNGLDLPSFSIPARSHSSSIRNINLSPGVGRPGSFRRPRRDVDMQRSGRVPATFADSDMIGLPTSNHVSMPPEESADNFGII
jgi:hypothetical protein